MVYIREAHAANGDRANRLSRELGINEHEDLEQRCETAEKFIKDKSLTMPMLIDDMENTTDAAYQAKPDRVFLIRTDGRLGVAGSRGPMGFNPAIEDCDDWLKEFVKNEKEPELSKETIAAADEKTKERAKAMSKDSKKKKPSDGDDDKEKPSKPKKENADQ